MALPWTFGVELEFTVAFVYPRSVALPDPTESRKLRFEPYQNEIDRFISEEGLSPIDSTTELADRNLYNGELMRLMVTPAVQRDIAQTLHAAGFPGNRDNPAQLDVANWQIDTDDSVRGPHNTKYLWSSIEVKSPALAFNSENLKAVEDVCKIISKTYLTDVGESAGLHVHVSAGVNTTFRLQTLQNLFAFLFAFEPQIDALHPTHRQLNDQFCNSLRRHSTFVKEWWNEYGQLPTIMQGVVELLKKNSLLELLIAVRWPLYDKGMRYNALNLSLFLENQGNPFNNLHPRTIEFRQHEGTLEPERIVQWIKALVGIINFVDTADRDSLTRLFRKAKEEKWQKESYPKDASMEKQLEPIPAEGSFTMIDLFRFIHLNEQADFYSSRLNDVIETEPPSRPTVWKWEYEELHSQSAIAEEEFQRQDKMRLLWQKSLTSSLAQPEGSAFNFDPDDQMWSTHERVAEAQTEGSNFASGFTFHRNDPIWRPADENAILDAEGDEMGEGNRQLRKEDVEEDL
ncbi:putative amidoligase enzyme-domain-containing protein [Hyaloscypha sp. PMI_1271]|nr:putative amidoligase enzyme-domain-containing protein [Hyaloscypha sp. PMI_1271]